MKLGNRRVSVAVAGAMACLMAAGGVAWVLNRSIVNAKAPQCGHWCVRRCCELLGAPVEMPEILEMLPPRANGHSMRDLAQVFKRIGLEVEGRRETIDGLGGLGFPCIVHLGDPDHFVTLTSADRRRVHLFDGAGRRTSRATRAFLEKWSGSVLVVRRRAPDVALPVYKRQDPGRARIQFEALFADCAELAREQNLVAFVYRFKNLGGANLRIEAVHKNCPCVAAILPKGPIAPGGDGEIKLKYEIGGRAGPFFQEVLVECNDPLAPLVPLKAAGYVDSGVRVLPPSLQFGDVVSGGAAVLRCFVSYSGDHEEFAVCKATCALPGVSVTSFELSDVAAVTRLWPAATRVTVTRRGTHVVEVALDPRLLPPGVASTTLTIETDVDGFRRIEVPVTARILPSQPVSPAL